MHLLMRCFVCAFLVQFAREAIADTTVWLNFPALPAAPTQAQRDAIKAGLEAKYAFEPNIRFTLQTPASGTPRVFVINFLRGSFAAYGDSDRRNRRCWVYMGNITPGTDGHPESTFFDTEAKRNTAMIETAAHELGHLFHQDHNCNAPNSEDTCDDPNGFARFKRMRGNGRLVNGRTGLMTDGRKVLPTEVVADMRDFTDGEKDGIRDFIADLKGPVTPSREPRTGNTTPSKSIKTIRGVRPEPVNPTPPFPAEQPCPRLCDLVDVHVDLFQNSGHEFGYVDVQGNFRVLIGAGEVTGDIAFEPGEILDFAVHAPNTPLNNRVSLTEEAFLPQVSQPVLPSNSVEPVVAQPYFRWAMLTFDADRQPATPPMVVVLSFGAVDVFDGLLPVPGCPPDFNNVNGVSVQDLFDFLAAWFSGDPRADFNGYGGISVQDIFDFLSAFFTPCP